MIIEREQAAWLARARVDCGEFLSVSPTRDAHHHV
jgi:hypothetical protein